MDSKVKEKIAREYCSQAAGKYLDTIGKHDLTDLTKDEWFEFLQIAHESYCEKFNELSGVPF